MQYTSQIHRFYDLLTYYVKQDWHAVKVYLYNGAILGICAWLCYLAYFLFFNKKISIPKSICFYLLAVYVRVLYQLTFLSRAAGSRIGIDLRPFATFTGGFRDMMYVAENILMFFPLGILLPLIWEKQRQTKVLFITAVLSSVAIEVMQLLTKRGYCQTDDVLMNTIGAMFGFFVYCFIRKKWGKPPKLKGDQS